MKPLHVLASAVVVALCAACGPQRRAEEIASASGAALFQRNCASCHGADGGGNGPVAPLLKVAVPDLTRITVRRNGKFPDLEIFQIIDGQAPLEAHGPRHMPVWGYEFFDAEEDDEAAHSRASERVDRLVAYLRGIQQHAP